MIFSTATFQSGAVQFARAHGIALVLVADGRTSYMSRSYDESPPPFDVPDFVEWIISSDDDGNMRFRRSSGQGPGIWREMFSERP